MSRTSAVGRRAGVPGDHRSATIAARPRRRQRHPLARGQRAEHIAGIAVGVADRQPAPAACAQCAGRDTPGIDAVAALIGVKRRGTARHPHARHGDLGAAAVLRGHAHLVARAAPLPVEIDPVEVEVETADRGVVAGIDGLCGIDPRDRRQRRTVDQEAAVDPADTGRRQGPGEPGQRTGVERRVAAALEDQIAAQHAARNRPGRAQCRGKAMPRPGRFERVKRGQCLHHAGRRQGAPGRPGLEKFAGCRIGHQERRLARKAGLGEQRLGRGPAIGRTGRRTGGGRGWPGAGGRGKPCGQPGQHGPAADHHAPPCPRNSVEEMSIMGVVIQHQTGGSSQARRVAAASGRRNRAKARAAGASRAAGPAPGRDSTPDR